MDILSKLPERLKDLMQEAELNVPALSNKINVEASAVLRIVKGERLPSATTLVYLADVFNCTTDYLIGLSDILDDRAFKQRPPFSEQLSYLLSYFKISKYRLEKATNIPEQTVNNWHKGKYEPTIESLIKLSKYFKCSVDFVLGREV